MRAEGASLQSREAATFL